MFLIIRTLNLVLVNLSLLWSLTTKLCKGSLRSPIFVMTAPDTDLGRWSARPSAPSPVIIIPVFRARVSLLFTICIPPSVTRQPPLIVFPQPETEKIWAERGWWCNPLVQELRTVFCWFCEGGLWRLCVAKIDRKQAICLTETQCHLATRDW